MARGDPEYGQASQGVAEALPGVADATSVRLVTRMSIRSADLCRRAEELSVARTRQVDSDGVTAETEVPVMVGSYYRLEFADPGLQSMLAQCESCVLIDPETVEVHFRFLEEMNLPPTED